MFANIAPDLTKHPLFQKLASELEEMRISKKVQAELEISEAQRLRAEAGNGVITKFNMLSEKYEVLRTELNQIVRELYDTNIEYGAITQQGEHTLLIMNRFRSIHLPTLQNPLNRWDSGMTTTEASMAAHSASRGRDW